MRLGRVLDRPGNPDERETLIEGVEAGDDLEIGHELVKVERSCAVDAADIEERIFSVFEEREELGDAGYFLVRILHATVIIFRVS